MSPSGLRPVVVVAEPRTGTNLLRTVADQSGAYRLAFEFLLPPNNPLWEQVNFWSVLDSIGRPGGCRWPRDGHHGDESFAAYFAEVTRRAEGHPLWFDVKYSQLFLFEDAPGADRPRLIERFAERSAAFVHVRRRNLVEQHLSLLRAVQTGEWRRSAKSVMPGRGHDGTAEPTVRVDVRNIVATLRELRRRERHLESMLGSDPGYRSLFYEDLLSEGRPSPQVAALFRDLHGVELPADLTPSILKISPPPDRLVENYGELRAALAGTEFAAMLPP